MHRPLASCYAQDLHRRGRGRADRTTRSRSPGSRAAGGGQLTHGSERRSRNTLLVGEERGDATSRGRHTRQPRPYLEEGGGEEPEAEEEEEEEEEEERWPTSCGRRVVPRRPRPHLEEEQAMELVEPTMRRVRVEPVPLAPYRMRVPPPAYYGTDEGGPRDNISSRIRATC